MLEDICDGNQTHPSIDKREARIAIRDCIKQNKSEWKGALRSSHKMGKVLHKVFSTIVKEISQESTNFGESGSEDSHFIPEPRSHTICEKVYIRYSGLLYWRFCRNQPILENLVQKCPISYQNLETLLKCQNCQKILENLG